MTVEYIQALCNNVKDLAVQFLPRHPSRFKILVNGFLEHLIATVSAKTREVTIKEIAEAFATLPPQTILPSLLFQPGTAGKKEKALLALLGSIPHNPQMEIRDPGILNLGRVRIKPTSNPPPEPCDRCRKPLGPNHPCLPKNPPPDPLQESFDRGVDAAMDTVEKAGLFSSPDPPTDIAQALEGLSEVLGVLWRHAFNTPDKEIQILTTKHHENGVAHLSKVREWVGEIGGAVEEVRKLRGELDRSGKAEEIARLREEVDREAMLKRSATAALKVLLPKAEQADTYRGALEEARGAFDILSRDTSGLTGNQVLDVAAKAYHKADAALSPPQQAPPSPEEPCKTCGGPAHNNNPNTLCPGGSDMPGGVS